MNNQTPSTEAGDLRTLCDETLADSCCEPLMSQRLVKWATRAQLLARALLTRLEASREPTDADEAHELAAAKLLAYDIETEDLPAEWNWEASARRLAKALLIRTIPPHPQSTASRALQVERLPLETLLAGRDDFIVKKGLWPEFTDSLRDASHPPHPQPTPAGEWRDWERAADFAGLLDGGASHEEAMVGGSLLRARYYRDAANYLRDYYRPKQAHPPAPQVQAP